MRAITWTCDRCGVTATFADHRGTPVMPQGWRTLSIGHPDPLGWDDEYEHACPACLTLGERADAVLMQAARNVERELLDDGWEDAEGTA